MIELDVGIKLREKPQDNATSRNKRFQPESMEREEEVHEAKTREYVTNNYYKHKEILDDFQ